MHGISVTADFRDLFTEDFNKAIAAVTMDRDRKRDKNDRKGLLLAVSGDSKRNIVTENHLPFDNEIGQKSDRCRSEKDRGNMIRFPGSVLR